MPFTPYLQASDLQNESAWAFTNWAPQIGSTGAYTTFLGTICTRAGQHVKWRVGSVDYATADANLQAVLTEIELSLAQYYLCLAVAAIAATSEDPTQNPVAGNSASAASVSLSGTAASYLKRAEQLFGLWGNASRPNVALPASEAGDPTTEILPNFSGTIVSARSS